MSVRMKKHLILMLAAMWIVWAWPGSGDAAGGGVRQDDQAQADPQSKPSESAPPTQDPAADEAEQDEPVVEETVIDLNENTMERFVRGLRSLRKYSRLAPEIVDIFTSSSQSAAVSTVRLYGNNRQVAVGIIVDSSGLILTKASELRIPLECQLPDGSRVAASIFGVDPGTDLAMLRVEVATPLPTANLAAIPAPPVGRWLASVAVDPQPISLGVVSVFQRRVASAQARIGIEPVNHEKGVRINAVTSNSPADRADLLINDIILRIDETVTPDQATLREVLAQYEPGDVIVLTILRHDQEMTVRLVLSSAEEIGGRGMENPQERMGSTLTRRKQSYALAFQHDSGLQANQCGSPLIDLEGQIVGINIARAGRVATYALPMEVVLPAVERLRTGELAPAVVFREELADLENQIQHTRGRLEALPGELSDAERELPRDAAKREELERMIAELQKRIAELVELERQRQESIEAKTEELKTVERELRRLEEKRDLLINGIR